MDSKQGLSRKDHNLVSPLFAAGGDFELFDLGRNLVVTLSHCNMYRYLSILEALACLDRGGIADAVTWLYALHLDRRGNIHMLVSRGLYNGGGDTEDGLVGMVHYVKGYLALLACLEYAITVVVHKRGVA